MKLLKPLFWFITGVWIFRLCLPLFAAPAWMIPAFSITMAVSISVLVAVVLIFARQFGSYANVVFSTFLLVAWGEVLVSAAIIFAVITGTDNIFTFPEYSLSGDPYHLKHITGHLTFSLGGATWMGSAVGCLLLFLLRLIVPERAVGEKESIS